MWRESKALESQLFPRGPQIFRVLLSKKSCLGQAVYDDSKGLTKACKHRL